VNPEGDLTPAQYELLAVAWNGPAGGMTVAEIWQAVADRRGVTRTTVLNLVDRHRSARATLSGGEAAKGTWRQAAAAF